MSGPLLLIHHTPSLSMVTTNMGLCVVYMTFARSCVCLCDMNGLINVTVFNQVCDRYYTDHNGVLISCKLQITLVLFIVNKMVVVGGMGGVR